MSLKTLAAGIEKSRATFDQLQRLAQNLDATACASCSVLAQRIRDTADVISDWQRWVAREVDKIRKNHEG